MGTELVPVLPKGRPSTYTPELTEIICDKLASGKSLNSICKEELMPHRDTVFLWLFKYKEFSDKYARARAAWADAEFENMMHIADTPQEGTKIKITDDGTETIIGDMIEHRRLQIDTRKFALARMEPRKYGDNKRIDVNNTGKVTHVMGDFSQTFSFIEEVTESESRKDLPGHVPDGSLLAPEIRTEPPICPE